MPFKRMLETISISSLKIVIRLGDNLPTEPGHLKFLNALQEDAGNNFSYLVPMNIVNGGGGG